MRKPSPGVPIETVGNIIRAAKPKVARLPYRKPDADALAILLRESADALDAAATTSDAKLAASLAAPRMREAAGRIDLAYELVDGYRPDSPLRRRLADALDGILARTGR